MIKTTVNACLTRLFKVILDAECIINVQNENIIV